MKKALFLLMMSLIFTFSATIAYAQNESNKGAKIVALESEYDFGTIKEADGPVTHTFIVKNGGTAPLVITRVNASCGCTKPVFSEEPIAPGKTGKISVTYNPAGRPGQFVKTIAIYSNGYDGATTVRIKGIVE